MLGFGLFSNSMLLAGLQSKSQSLFDCNCLLILAILFYFCSYFSKLSRITHEVWSYHPTIDTPGVEKLTVISCGFQMTTRFKKYLHCAP